MRMTRVLVMLTVATPTLASAQNLRCQWPDTETSCRSAYSRDEVEGSRDDILAQTTQRYVWTWVYPCGNCANYEFVHERDGTSTLVTVRPNQIVEVRVAE